MKVRKNLCIPALENVQKLTKIKKMTSLTLYNFHQQLPKEPEEIEA